MAAVQWKLYVARKATGQIRRDMGHIQKLQPIERRKVLKALDRTHELDEIEQHVFLDMLGNGNPYFTGRDVRWLSSIWHDLVGDVFLIKERNGMKVPSALWPVPPHWVAETPTPSHPFFRVARGAWQQQIPASEVLWIQNPNPADPYGRGTGLGKAIDDEIALDEYAAKHTASFFKNSARPDVIVMPKDGGQFSDADATRFQQFWNEQLQGFWRGFKPLFLKTPIEVKTLDQNFRNMQLKELRDQERDTIIQTWGVPPELFGIVTSSNRSTIDMAPYIFATYVLVPRLERMRDTLQARLMPEYDESIILDYVSPVPEDRLFKQSVMNGQPGAFYANEFRELAGLPPEDELDEVLMSGPAAPGQAPAMELPENEEEAAAAVEDLDEEETRQLDRLLFKMARKSVGR
jgi:HK97 family phage portal protein